MERSVAGDMMGIHPDSYRNNEGGKGDWLLNMEEEISCFIRHCDLFSVIARRMKTDLNWGKVAAPKQSAVMESRIKYIT
ncbi:MAG: hypothetical protein ABI237_06745 [Ginsengibacter sp.]